MIFTIRVTQNLWDAPVTVTLRDDGTASVTREPPPGGDDFVWHCPHGVLEVAGHMSPFDQARQPADPLAARLASGA